MHELAVVPVAAKPGQLVVFANVRCIVHATYGTKVLGRADGTVQTRVLVGQNRRLVALDVILVTGLPTVGRGIVRRPGFVHGDVAHFDGEVVVRFVGVNGVFVRRISRICLRRCASHNMVAAVWGREHTQ
jgi:hypothetical protein